MILVPRSHTHTHKSERMKSMAPLLFSTLAFGAKSRCLAIWSEKGAPGGGFLGLRAMQPFQKPFYFHTFGFSPFSVVDSHLFRETRRPSTSYTDEDYMLLSFVYFLFFPFSAECNRIKWLCFSRRWCSLVCVNGNTEVMLIEQ